ncbi:hypothetical protein ACFU8W_33765 [Streptomyces sp. NPDC057565]|uniref:hypothetical protein n=1 Tax=Streptomyces sp. NPDC057565 TaxID=3346169 RepID=UPI0036B5F7B4
MSLTMPAALVASLGASIGGLGAWGAIVLWAVSMVLATATNWIYTELAAMFPESSGGIAHYATEGWKSRAPVVGPLAGVGPRCRTDADSRSGVTGGPCASDSGPRFRLG